MQYGSTYLHPLRPSRILPILAVVAAVGWASGTPAGAQPDGRTHLANFQLTGRYMLYANRQPVPQAQVFHSASSGAYLVKTEALPTTVLIYLRTQCVEGVGNDEMSSRSDGGLDLHLKGTPCEHGKIRLAGADILFQVGNIPARLRPKPPLLGGHYAAGVIQHTPEYVRAARLYRPDTAYLRALAGSATKARVVVYFGSWCSRCKRLVPQVLRVEQELAKLGSKLSFDYFGLPAQPAYQSAPAVRQMRLTKLPAVLIFVGNREIGRFHGDNVSRPEAGLARFIR